MKNYTKEEVIQQLTIRATQIEACFNFKKTAGGKGFVLGDIERQIHTTQEYFDQLVKLLQPTIKYNPNWYKSIDPSSTTIEASFTYKILGKDYYVFCLIKEGGNN